MQHKRELGPKTITKVTVFRAETDDDFAFVDPSLVFWCFGLRMRRRRRAMKRRLMMEIEQDGKLGGQGRSLQGFKL